ncbi:Retrovirus-related Pol polyprotein from transposon TNT 1-94 [Gossypium australe]|uniref:Retrovirus-related Pol polyprotein from transposon TNT 1-94 n=1 Tax=Gossypium australe TaxID=47621 RepID=A0A5B6V0R9_9ROSI|nr:Retrovirus-related Pol polyprotein from transposon TNT 1-94 [Gossypium australe]
MGKEIESLHKKDTWKLVEPLTKNKIVGCKCVFKNNEGSGQGNTRYKSRLVAKSYCQVDCEAYVHLSTLDVKTAFLHGDLDEDIYMQQTEGFKIEDKKDHSPQQWYTKFNSFMLGIGFVQSKYDSCVYLQHLDDGSFIYLLLYVDDMLIVAKDPSKIERLKTMLNSKFEIKDLGATKKNLRMEISRDQRSRKFFLSQQGYIERILERFGMQDSKPGSTSLAAHFKLLTLDSLKTKDEETI